MAGLAKIGPMTGLLVAFMFLSSAESTRFDCDLDATNIINFTGSDYDFVHLNVLNLKATPVKTSCTWNISQSIGNTFLEFSRVTLSSLDSIEVVGHMDSDVTLYNSTGSPLPGLVSTGRYNYVLITLKFASNVSDTRVYSSVFYFKSTSLHLQQDSGLYSFPLTVNNSTKIQTSFLLQPDLPYVDRVIMLNFTQLPKKFSIALNGVAYNETSPPPNFYLGTTASLNVSLDYTSQQKDDIFIARYWLVTGECSGNVQLSKVNDIKQIAHPNETFRLQQHLTTIRCAQFFTSPAGTKFQVVIDPKISGLANSGDQVNIYKVDGTLELGLNNPALMYFRTIDNIVSANQILVVYDSPYHSVPNDKFDEKALSVKVIAESQADYIILSDKDYPIQLKQADKNTPIVHMIYPVDMADTKRVVVEFPNVTITPGKMTIAIYNSEAAQSVQPIVTLGQFDRLPLVIASNGPTLRVVYSGDLSQLANVTYRLVEPNACQSLATFAPTFEVVGGEHCQPCSWYIPESKASNFTIINPTIVKIPSGKTLTVTSFSKDGSKVATYPGPLDKLYFPDMFWNPKNSYQFTLDSGNVSKDSLHLLVAKKNNYLTETMAISSKAMVPSVSSANYPGNYPVGLVQNWMFISETKDEWALITLKEVDLAAEHNLALVMNAGEKNQQLFKGDVNLTGFPDYLVKYPFALNLDTKAFNMTSFSARGFKVDLKYPGVANNYTMKAKETTEINFNMVNATKAKPLNIWRVTVGDGSALLSDTILRINVTLAEGMDKTKATLKVYDSISMRPQNVHLANGSVSGTSGFYLGSIKSALIEYDYSASFDTKANFSISITVSSEVCSNGKNYTTKCHTTDRCITTPMVCNGINECGDWTDELYCNGNHPPPPPPAPVPASGGGVNTLVVIFVLMPMAAILGIVGYIYLPQFLLRIRRGRYSEFRDLSEVS